MKHNLMIFFIIVQSINTTSCILHEV